LAVDNEKILKNMNNLVDLNLKEINEKINIKNEALKK
jgi:hypothetical protein